MFGFNGGKKLRFNKLFLIILLVLTLIIGCVPLGKEGGIDPWKVDETTEEESQEEVEESEDIIEEEQEEVVEETEEPEEEVEEQFEIILTAVQTNDTVELSWTKYEGEFKAYKVSRSVIHSNPQYPGHRLRKTIPYVNETSYVDTLPAGGRSYYVVTALTPLNEKIHSNAVKIEFSNQQETPDQDISLTAKKTEDGIELEWTRYDGDFLFYRIVRTVDHPYPKYPDDDTVGTVAYQNITSFLDPRPEEGINYYAVTIVRPDKTRFTSERASVNVEVTI